MILSFHPIFRADKNIICAGREPTADDRRAVLAADAVILPQGCGQALYQLARQNCAYIFPNYDTRFRYPDKISQIRLFQETNVAHPQSEVFYSTRDFWNGYNGRAHEFLLQYPLFFKFNWGGEGDTVFLIHSEDHLKELVQQAAVYERGRQKGFIIQEYIPNSNRTLRVAVIGQKRISYWRIQKNKENFHTSLAKGAVIDREASPELQKRAISATDEFCQKTKIDLAGFDIIFSDKNEMYFLEINYFFGRRGLGGSERYYQMLSEEIKAWLNQVGLT
jgi:ribosomal protein S6--L-glutamate ligase